MMAASYFLIESIPLKHLLLFYIFAISILATSCSKDDDDNAKAPNKVPQETPRVLVFTKTAGFRHASIPAGVEAIKTLGQQHNFKADTTQNAAYFNSDSLSNYKAVIFLSTTGDVLSDEQQTAFEQYIKAGGGFVGIHAATDTEYSWPWYNQLVGAYFSNHPAIQQATIHITDSTHRSTTMLPTTWVRTDEWYNFRSMNPSIKVLANLDETTYSGGTHGTNHHIAWYHNFDGGRAFYTAGGHTTDSFTEPLFLQHLLGGILHAIGD